MLLVSILIHAMMQQFTVAEGIECSKVSCISDCPLETLHRDGQTPDWVFQLKNIFANEQDTKEFYNSQSRSHDQLMVCCRSKCKEFCVANNSKVVSDGTEWVNADDACTTHICNKGVISNHTSVCSGLPCSREHYIMTPGHCCPKCSSEWATFCPEEEECDIACQHGFVVDLQRGCDLCRCARTKVEMTTSSSSPSLATTQNAPASTDDATRSVHFYFYLDPTDSATRNLLLGLTVACCVILVACLAGIAWFFHKKVYKRVPLLSLRNSSA